MDRGTVTEDTLLPAPSLWVVVSGCSRSDCFELDGIYRRAIVVGSCVDADIRITGALLAPVECFLVREGDEIRLVPACASSAVRIGSVRVEQPTRLWRKTIVEVGGIDLEVRIREEPPTAPDHEQPTQGLPSRQEAMADACSAHRSESNLTDSALSSRFGQGLDDGGVLVCPIVPVGIIDAGATRIAETAQRRALVSAVVKQKERANGRDNARNRLGARLSDVPLGHAALRNASGEPALPSGPASAYTESPPSSTAPAMISARALSRAPAAGLEQLGLLTQRRPALVALTGSIGAAAIAVALHWGAIALDSGRRPAQTVSFGVIALLSPVRPFCGAAETACKKVGSPRRAACGCLPFASAATEESWVRKALRYDVVNATQGLGPPSSEPIQIILVSPAK